MSYDIHSQLCPNGRIQVYESKSNASVILENRSDNLYMVYCDAGNSNAIEYPLLEGFFEKARCRLNEFKQFPFKVSIESRKRRDELLLQGYSSTAIVEILTKEFPAEGKKIYSGCMLGIKYAEKAEILNEINENGDLWCDDTTEDELYIIVGKNLSNIDVKVIDSLKDKWHKAKIFTLHGFLNFIRTGESDDYTRKDFNNFIKHCHFGVDGYFKWPHTNTYPGPGIFNATKELLQIGVLAAMGYHVGSKGLDVSSRHKILQNAYITAVPFVEIDNMKEWNAPKTPWRLKKIAYCLATFAKNAKRRSNSDSFWQAIEDWEDDLAWLKRNFYTGIYDSKFVWPDKWSE